jgi:hypothetical protein
MTNDAKPKRKSKKKTVKTESPKKMPLSDIERQELKDFARFSIGDPHLTVFEENFVNRMKQISDYNKTYISEKQNKIIDQIKQKLHYDHPEDQLDPVDMDGVDEDNDPDGYDVDPDGFPIRRESDIALYQDFIDIERFA